MLIGVPKETKDGEKRVAITPAGVRALTEHGHRVLVETSGGLGSRITDSEFRRAGALIAPSAEAVFARAELILKVKEPLPPEHALLRPGQILFTYLHLASSRELVQTLCRAGVVAIGYETVQLDDGSLPLLLPMSEIAGKMSVQVGAHLLQAENGGRGTL